MTKVRLDVYAHTPKETIVESFKAKEWDDFIIVQVTGGKDFKADTENLATILAKKFEDSDKQVILVDDSFDVQVFGVKEVE